MSSIADFLSSLLACIRLPDEMQTISTDDFNAIRDLIYRDAGISLNDSEKALVSSRLAKRLVRLNLDSYSEYLEDLAVRDPDGIEHQAMVNCSTRNKTDFFREPHHFEFLRKSVFPKIESDAQSGKPHKIRIWNAASSTDEEPYSTTITVLEHFGFRHAWDIRILASDINTDVLETAGSHSAGIPRLENGSGEIAAIRFHESP